MIIFGGMGNDAATALGDVWLYAFETGEWRNLPLGTGVRPVPRCMHTCTATDGALVILGGVTDTPDGEQTLTLDEHTITLEGAGAGAGVGAAVAPAPKNKAEAAAAAAAAAAEAAAKRAREAVAAAAAVEAAPRVKGQAAAAAEAQAAAAKRTKEAVAAAAAAAVEARADTRSLVHFSAQRKHTLLDSLIA
jgi:hypothetical protein